MNSRNELLSACRHRKDFLLCNQYKALSDRENTISNLQHKLAEVTKERDELKRNYSLIVEQQQKTHSTNNENVSPPNTEINERSVEHLINTPSINVNSSCELDNSVGEFLYLQLMRRKKGKE